MKANKVKWTAAGYVAATSPDGRTVVCARPAPGAGDVAMYMSRILDEAVRLNFDTLPAPSDGRFIHNFLKDLSLSLTGKVPDSVVVNLEDAFYSALIMHDDDYCRVNLDVKASTDSQGSRIDVTDHFTAAPVMTLGEGKTETPVTPVTPSLEGAKSLRNMASGPAGNIDLQSGSTDTSASDTVGDPAETSESSGIPVPPVPPVIPADPQPPVPRPEKKGWRVSGWFMIAAIVAVIAFGVMTVKYIDASDSLDFTKTRLTEAESKMEETKYMLNRAADVIPFVVESIKIGVVDNNENVITPYGQTINSYATRYLSPQIEIFPLVSGKYKLDIKLYNSYGNLDRSDSSPAGCSYQRDITVSRGVTATLTLGGWGRDTANAWPSGSYRYEVWCNGLCLASKTFRVN